MEGFRRESEPRIDFLDENLIVTFDIDRDALSHLPLISPEDRQIGRERFGVLLGSMRQTGDNQAHIQIKGIYQEPEGEDTYGSYREGKEEVIYNPILLRSIIRRLQQIPEYRNFYFLGDIHTHPTSLKAKPSNQDLQAHLHAYQDGIVKSHEPFIFGIAGIGEDGDMEYWFYRLVRTKASSSGFGYKALD